MKYQIKKLLVKGQENKKYSKLRKQDKEINLKQCNTKSNFKSYIYIYICILCIYLKYISSLLYYLHITIVFLKNAIQLVSFSFPNFFRESNTLLFCRSFTKLYCLPFSDFSLLCPFIFNYYTYICIYR